MDKKKIYSIILFAFVALIVANSVILLGINNKTETKSLSSILKNNDFEKYIGTWHNDADTSGEEVDENFLIDGEEIDEEFLIEDEEDNSAFMQTQSAKSGVVIEQSSRRVLLNENMNTACYPASTTKVLTAFVVLNNLPLDRVVTVPREAEGVEGSSIYLRKGQKITVKDLLYGLMLRSGNDAAVTLAIETAGSIDNFALLMNETAKQLGAINSHFVNPHGLHDDNHYTTAYDLAVICAAAYENEEFVKIVSTKTAKIVVDGEAQYIGNKNKLLKLYEGANGVKTGYTKKSGRCLVGGAMREGMQLISVVLNYNDMWNDTIRMLNYGFDNYNMVPIDNALLHDKENMTPININDNYPLTPNFEGMCYPLRRDGSEYIVLTSKHN